MENTWKEITEFNNFYEINMYGEIRNKTTQQRITPKPNRNITSVHVRENGTEMWLNIHNKDKAFELFNDEITKMMYKEGFYQLNKINDKIHKKYFISKTGEIYNYSSGRFIKPEVRADGYLSVRIHGKWYRVHRLVMIAFNPFEENKLGVTHIDGNRKNNNLENLQWRIRKERKKRK